MPIFFLMSGYLFFYNLEFSKNIYVRKLKSRFRSLFVPYMFWNVVSIFLMVLVAALPFTASFFENQPTFDFNYVLSSLFGRLSDNGFYYPIAIQFWFIRDLMVLVILSPLVYWLIRKSKGFIVLVAGVCWLLGLSVPYLGVRCINTEAWFFFMLGAGLSIGRKNVVEFCGRIGWWVLPVYAILAVGDLFVTSDVGYYFHQIGVLVGIVCWFKSATYLIDVKGVKQAPILATSSFFVFAFHEPFGITPLKNLLMRFINPSSDLALIVSYFGIATFVVLVALGLYCLLRKFLPRFTAVITGGRV